MRHNDPRNQRVPLPECVPRRLYKLSSRNLRLGVFDGKTGFIGIREKFGHHYLFTEYHWDTGAPYGTVSGVVDTGIDMPVGVPLVDHGPTIDRETMEREKINREVAFDRPIADGGRGWYFKDTNEASQAIHPMGLGNGALFDWLNEKEKELGTPG